jgi:hypothetical protein
MRVSVITNFSLLSHHDQSERTASNATAGLENSHGHHGMSFGSTDPGFNYQDLPKDSYHQQYDVNHASKSFKQQSSRSSKEHYDENGKFDNTYPTTNVHSHPKMSSILLYNSSSNNQKSASKGTKKSSGQSKMTSNAPVSSQRKASSSERKRTVSAGRMRRKGDSGPLVPERTRALDRMFGDHVIEELDLALQVGKGTNRNSRQHGGYDFNSRYDY